MKDKSEIGAIILGIAIFLGLVAVGYYIRSAAISFKQFERVVTVKGLAEQEHLADIVIWPIQFSETGNSLDGTFTALDNSAEQVEHFLLNLGLTRDEITFSSPLLTDRSALLYGSSDTYQYRYIATQTVTVYSEKVEEVRKMMNQLGELGKQGVSITGDEYQIRPEYIFNRLNEIKPDMIEQATREARIVAEKFAEDSDSELGKIKRASQGQFTISSRDNNNPHIKNVRVVSTIEYYLSD